MGQSAVDRARTCRAVPINSLRCDDEVCARVSLDSAVVAHYAGLIAGGTMLPPVLAYDDGSSLWLVDGCHRLAAHRKAERESIVCEIHRGSREDAIWCSCNVNQSHGLRRSNLDKHRSVARALLHPRGMRLSNRQIARYCGVHHHSVGRIRAELEASGAIRQINRRLVERNGSIYEHEVSAIAGANAARSTRPPPIKPSVAPNSHHFLAPVVQQLTALERELSRVRDAALRGCLEVEMTLLGTLLERASQLRHLAEKLCGSLP